MDERDLYRSYFFRIEGYRWMPITARQYFKWLESEYSGITLAMVEPQTAGVACQ